MADSTSGDWGYFVMNSVNFAIASSNACLRLGSVAARAEAFEERICGRKLLAIWTSSGASPAKEEALFSVVSAWSYWPRKYCENASWTVAIWKTGSVG